MYARSKAEAGFTIVETLIVVAISGLMFVVAAHVMSGKQQQTEFSTGVNTLNAQLHQALSDVEDGNYPSLEENNVQCTDTLPPGDPQFDPSLTAPDGTCTVIGEIIAFSGQLNPENQESFAVYPAIGYNYIPSRFDPPNSTTPVTNLAEADPHADSPYGTTTVMPFGLAIDTSPLTAVTIPTDGGSIGVFNFNSFASSTAVSGSLASGSAHIEIFEMPQYFYTFNTYVPLSQAAAISTLTDSGCNGGQGHVCSSSDTSDASPINPTSGITFCVDSGTSNSQSALFTIGGSGSPTSVSVQLYSQSRCTDA